MNFFHCCIFFFGINLKHLATIFKLLYLGCSITTAPVVANTTRVPSTGGVLVPGSSISYHCISQLESLTPNTVVCQEDGAWSPSSLGTCQQTGTVLC